MCPTGLPRPQLGDSRNPVWKTTRAGHATVTFGQPYYGKQKIIANAPLSAQGFRDLISALEIAAALYVE